MTRATLSASLLAAALAGIPTNAQVYAQQPAPLTSPDGSLSLDFSLSPQKSPTYQLWRNGAPVLLSSRLGLLRDDEDFSANLTLTGASPVEPVTDTYELLTAKRRHNTYKANGQTFHLAAPSGKKIDIRFQLSNDGLAFRYHFPETSTDLHMIKEELTSFHLPPTSVAWLQPMSIAKSGWAQTNPSYEEYYFRELPVGTPPKTTDTTSPAAGWVFPALFHTPSPDNWLLLSEAAPGRTWCGTRLRGLSPDGEYTIAFPDPKEIQSHGPVNPQSTLPWSSPWRIIAIGSLKTIAESTLGTDLADPPAILNPLPAWIQPGKASWSWPLLGDKHTDFATQKRFIDYAADMSWNYCLIDALWDKQIGYDKIKELADYAATKNVGLLLWYNSAGPWNTSPQTPRDKMLTHDSRTAEFQKLQNIGIKGIKVDFFGGDSQETFNYYQDILEDAAAHHLLVNFHGATLPRGWQRTYPNLMTMESIRGFEFLTFDQKNTDEEPTHASIIPFTRNVFDPMDFTPVCLDKIKPTITRRTTPAFELALAVLFTSGIQHYAEIPEGMAKMPDFVQNYMKKVPFTWDESKLIDGYPGKFAVFARKSQNTWYLAGINSESTPLTLTLNLSDLPDHLTGDLITDGDGQPFKHQPITVPPDKKIPITLHPAGGFVMTLH